jgi:hypothetical protein
MTIYCDPEITLAVMLEISKLNRDRVNAGRQDRNHTLAISAREKERCAAAIARVMANREELDSKIT